MGDPLEPPARGGFGASFSRRLQRSAAGVQLLFKDEAVREKAGALLSKRLGGAKEGLRASLAGVLAKVQEADAVRALLRRGAEDDPERIDLEVGGRCYEDVPKRLRTHLWLSLLDQQEPSASSGAPRRRRGRKEAEPPEQLDDLAAMLCESSYYTSLLETFDNDGGASNPGGGDSEDGGAEGSGWAEDVGNVISRDISRTFPGHRLFAKASGRASLQRLLHAYAIHDPAVGYCQGMAFVAGMLLMYLEEHRAFAAFVTLMHGARLRELYLPGMAALQLRLRQLGELLKRRLPRLAAHLEAHDVQPVIYASSWFLTLYAAEFPWSSPDGNANAPWSFTARVMDVCLAERSSAVMLRVALGLLDQAEESLLELHSFEELVVYLKVELKAWPAERLRETLSLSLHMEGVADSDLERITGELAKADAAAAERAARRGGGGAVTVEGAAGLLAEDADLTRPAAGHVRTRSSSIVEVLLEMDMGSRAGPVMEEEEEEDWALVEKPMSEKAAAAAAAAAKPTARQLPAGAASREDRERELLTVEAADEGALQDFPDTPS